MAAAARAWGGEMLVDKTIHHDSPANGQAVIWRSLYTYISEIWILATVSDNSVRYQAVNVVKTMKNKQT